MIKIKKRLIIFILAAVLVLCATGCSGSTSLKVWEEVCGSFVREDSSQYNNAALSMKYLSDNCVMFEFKLMEGSEAENFAHDIFIPGVLLVNDKGAGFYETNPDSLNQFTINFKLSEDGQQITVTHTGDLIISPDGRYVLWNVGVDVSMSSAKAIIEYLPSAVTSLNSNIGAYTVNYPESLVADWFYIVEATFDDTGAVLSKFLIAKDLSAVFRADDDIEPVLIFGSAQPMMDAEVFLYTENDKSDKSGASGESEEGKKNENEESNDIFFYPSPLVSVEIENGISIATGSSGRLTASLPWELPYTITAKSSDETVAKVDENGVIRAIAEGETTISGTIAIEDGVKDFTIEISVTNELEQEEVVN